MSEIMNEYINELLTVFPKVYNFIYDSNDKIPGFRFFVKMFDDRFSAEPDFADLVFEFGKRRQDPIASDREAAAFMYTIAEIAEIGG